MATAYNLDTLIADLKKGSYTPKSEQEIQGIADRRYQSYYDQQRLGAQQAAETTGLALNRQMGEVSAAYGKQREQSAQQYKQASSDTGRALLSRGMQRSSYGVATLGDIAVAGNKAQQDIADTEQRAVGGIQDQQTLLARQLADQLRQYSASQAADTLSYIDELESREYDRGTAADQYHNSLAAQIYQFATQEKQQDQAAQQWTQQFNESVRQYDSSLAQSATQFAESKALQQQQFAAQQQQFDAGHSLEQQRLAESIRQYNESISQNQGQFDAELALKQQQTNALYPAPAPAPAPAAAPASAAGGSTVPGGFASTGERNRALAISPLLNTKAKYYEYLKTKQLPGSTGAGTGTSGSRITNVIDSYYAINH